MTWNAAGDLAGPSYWSVILEDGTRMAIADNDQARETFAFLDRQPFARSLVRLPLCTGEVLTIRAGWVVGWVPNTPAGRARQRDLEAALEAEEPEKPEWEQGGGGE